DVELARDEQIVQLGRRAGDELAARRQRYDAAVERPVDRRAVDVADAADLHRTPVHTLKRGPGDALPFKGSAVLGALFRVSIIPHHPPRSPLVPYSAPLPARDARSGRAPPAAPGPRAALAQPWVWARSPRTF